MDKRLPEVLQSLRPGVSFAEVEAAGQQLGHPLPAGLAAIYRSAGWPRVCLRDSAGQACSL